MKSKSKIIMFLAIIFSLLLTSCSGGTKTNLESETRNIIKQAQSMTLEQLAQKAIEESNGKTFYGLGNSSRGKSALPLFIEYLKSIDSSYDMTYEWQQPKNNKIFDQLTADASKDVGTFSMTLIQDGNQIESKMVKTGVLATFIPSGYAKANGIDVNSYDGYVQLQTLNKVFMYNITGDKTFKNVWDFVKEGESGLFMDIDSEIVGKNFLYMLTKDEYANNLKDSFDKISNSDEKSRIETIANQLEETSNQLQLGENGKYSLAWIKLWVESYNAQSDDGPICNTLVNKTATDQFGLLVYSKLRSVEESDTISKANIKIAAYDEDYVGFGGYGYSHYLFVTENSPLPWTACAFIAYLTETVEGFSAWGKDIGGYSGNPEVAKANEELYNHLTEGDRAEGGPFEALNDRGFNWWQERLIIEDPKYCAQVSFTVGEFIDGLKKK